jgi:hypothetical protein
MVYQQRQRPWPQTSSDLVCAYLLKEYAEIDAKIQIPESWKDPQMDL